MKIVIIGASIAGMNVMNKLVKEEFNGEITLIDKSDTLPYNPYKLTKDWMLDLENTTPPLLKKESFYKDNNIELKLKTDVVSIDPIKQTITTNDNQIISYDKCIIASGSKLNKLDTKAQNLLYLRTFNDALEIKKQAKTHENFTIIGAGFIGLELAASLSSLNKKVNVILRHPLPLEKTLGKRAAEHIFNLLKNNGVNFITNDSVNEFHISNNIITSITTKNNLTLDTDCVIGAIGVKPNIPFDIEGLEIDKGIVVNEYHQTSLPNIYAAGDNTVIPHGDAHIHLEHWESAYYSGINVAKNIMSNNTTPYDVVPYFWTDLYDETFEVLGYASSFEYAFVRESDDPKQFMVAYTDKDYHLLSVLFSNHVLKRKDASNFLKNTSKIDPKEFTNPNHPLF